MKEKKPNSTNRRKFLALGLMGGAGVVSQKVTAMVPVPQEEEETVPMLTPDGKLVQVSKKVIEQMQERHKAANKDILNWATTQEKTKT